MRNSRNIFDNSRDDIFELFSQWGEPSYRATQAWEGLYKNFWVNPDEFTTFPKLLKTRLIASFGNKSPDNLDAPTLSSLVPVKKIYSKDGETTKTLFTLWDGNQVEAVLMRYSHRRTLCISTQAGCAMGCVFCATGQMGFKRNLTSGEIIEQVLYYSRQLKLAGEQVTNIVLMGMGEPFHNYDASMEAITRLNESSGYNLGARRFTISTAGLVPGIRRFTQAHSQVNLAISLHAAEDNLRSQLLPLNKKYPLDQLLSACLEYVQISHRRLSFEWALIKGVNDSAEHAKLLIQRLKPFKIHGSMLCHVNVIPLNPTRNYDGSASTHNQAQNFKRLLEDAGIPCTIRIRRGIEIQAGCGQLASTSS
jgi:23S rRNA (adenine2503-C2)-methyltransferase